jgi:hypothetical protein
MLETKLLFSNYLLGACVFHHRDFIQKLLDVDFFDKFLFYTNDFSQGFFPGYEEQGGYDFGEHLYPTLAAHYGGNIAELAKYVEREKKWHGYYEHFPVRFRPPLESLKLCENACIMHPVKNYNHPIRKYHRKKRGSQLDESDRNNP